MRFQSLGANFSAQLASLMATLSTTTPYFVRCVNPNNVKRPNYFDDKNVRPQLRYARLCILFGWLRLLVC